ncbi:DUF349 domain-containing protein [Allonocardiopsis opalescens]|uniref:Uncharacterized protein DUF349 n=1 Tax=Allonocardiopsis opalescens TaxID=1144618 RepID=A0A2T0PWY5_9ACTN|nr:DUF349 domain-containing protein [Allonocardiopsis opalescens]PRX96045.1 uncharacterized protein DUF349 [Allonocardiopsis opalescens]
MSTDPWGRVDADGTVYVRTADGERVVGSWQAGEPEEALAFFHRKFDSLSTEVDLLEQRIKTTDLPAAQAGSTIARLRESIVNAAAVGDLDGLAKRLDGLTELVDQRREEQKAAREEARENARDVKERIVAEAERIAEETTHWKSGGERMRQLVEEWKTAPRADRATEQALWKRLSSARSSFTKRRKAYFAGLDSEREQAKEVKEEIVAEAEAIADSTDWNRTASRYRELMQRWKSAGRAQRDAEDRLWGRFKAAQDRFFQARSAVFAERDAELSGNAEAKEALLTEAKRILPITDLRAGKAALRDLQERWEAIGPVPRDSRDRLEGGLRKIEEAVRKAEDSEWRRTNPEARARAEATVNQLRTSIEQFEKQLERARAAGNERKIHEADEALAARRSWLAEAERTLNEFS